MPRVMTIDDSKTIRTIVTKQMTELGFEIETAEDGQQGLAKLEEIEVDLILLDVTMPVMDGPTMLQNLRAIGNKTPVIMLTSESKRTVVSGAIKLGIDDYILKPFKPEELQAKVLKALRMDGSGARAGGAVGAAPEVAAAPPPAFAQSAPSAGRQFIDVLVIDDMENVHKRLRTLLPQHLTLNGCVSARDALQHCQDRVYRVVVIDQVIPDVNSVALMNQLRALQPHAIMVALSLRAANDASGEIKAQGFQDLIYKPFDADAIDEFLSRYFEVNEVLAVDGNVLTAAAVDAKNDKNDRVERYYVRMRGVCNEHFEKIASACFEDVIVDLGQAPLRNDKTMRIVLHMVKEAERLGLALRVVGNAELKKVLGSVADTQHLPVYTSVDEARALAA